MADKERLDINLDSNDDDFSELDKLLNEGFEDPDISGIDDSSGPVEGVLGKTSKVLKEELGNIGNIAEKVAESIMDNLPDSIKVYVDAGKEVTEKVEKSVEQVTNVSRKIGYGLLGKLENMVPEGTFRNKLSSLREAIKPNEETTYYYREETDEEKALKQVSEVLGEQLKANAAIESERAKLEEAKFKTQIDYLKEQTISLNVLRDYTLNVLNKYHRKSLELQIRQLIISDKLFTLLNKDIPVISTQLEAIVKNTSIPDMVKLNTGEYLKEKFRQSMVSKGLNILKENQLVKTLRDKISDKITEIVGNVTGTTDQLEMLLDSGMDIEGLDKTEMMISMALDSVLKGTTNKIVKFAKKRLANSKYAGELSTELSKLDTDPKRALLEIANKLESKGGKASIFANVIRSLADSISEGIPTTRLSENNLNEPTYLDNRMKKSITVVIPGLLSKILAEVTAIRQGKRTPGEEYTYDYEKNRFVSTTELKRELIKEQLNVARNVTTKMSDSFSRFFHILDKDKTLSDTDRKVIVKALVPYLLNGGSTDIRYMVTDNFQDMLPKTTARKFMRIVNKLIKSRKIKDAERILELSSILKDIKGEILTSSDTLIKKIEKLNRIGRLDVAAKLGLLNKRDYTSVSGSDLVNNIGKYTTRQIDKYGLDIRDIEDENLEEEDLFDKLYSKTKEAAKSAKERATKGFKTARAKFDNIYQKAKEELERHRREKILEHVVKWESGDLNGVRKFSKGGYTGEGHPEEPAGIVHKDEYVVNKSKLDKLESLAKALTNKLNEKVNINRENALDRLLETTEELVKDAGSVLESGKETIKSKLLKLSEVPGISKVKEVISSVSESKAATKLKHNLREIRKMVDNGTIDEVLKKYLAKIPLPENYEEAINEYNKILTAIDPTGKLQKLLAKKQDWIAKMNALHAEAIAEQQEEGLTENEEKPRKGLLGIYDKVTKKLNEVKGKLFDKFKSGIFGVLGRAAKGFKKGLAPVKEDLIDLLYDEYGNLDLTRVLNPFRTAKFLGKTYINTAKATGYATREIYGGMYGGVKTAISGAKNKIMDRLKVNARDVAIAKAPLPDNVKEMLYRGEIDFKDAIDYLKTPKEKDKYIKWLEKKGSKSSILSVAANYVKKAAGVYTGTAKATGKAYSAGVKTATEKAPEVLEKTVTTLNSTVDKLMNAIGVIPGDKSSKSKTGLFSSLASIFKTKEKKEEDAYLDQDHDGVRDGSWKERLNKLYGHKEKEDKTEKIIEKSKSSSTSMWGLLMIPLMAFLKKATSFFDKGVGHLAKTIIKGIGDGLWNVTKWLGKSIWSGLEHLGGSIIRGIGSLISHIPGVKTVTNLATKAVDFVKDKFTSVKNVAKSAWNKVTGLFTNKAAGKVEKAVAEKALKKEVKAGAIKAFLHKLKKILIEKLGAKAAVKFLGKIAARFVPFAGWAMLAYDAAKVAWYMFHDGLSFKSAVSKQILGFDIFNDNEPAIDPDTGEPIKPDIPKDKIKKAEKKVGADILKKVKKDDKDKNKLSNTIAATTSIANVDTDDIKNIPGITDKYTQSMDTKSTIPGNINKDTVENIISQIQAPVNKKALVSDLIRHEGLKLHAYYDSRGYKTIGVGHLLDKSKGGIPLSKIIGKDTDYITEDEALKILTYDVNRTAKYLYNKFPWLKQHPEPVQRYLIDMAFNMGVNGLAKFNRTLKLIKQGKYREAGINLTKTKWYRQVGNRAREIVSAFVSLGDRVSSSIASHIGGISTDKEHIASTVENTKNMAKQYVDEHTNKDLHKSVTKPAIPAIAVPKVDIGSEHLNITNDLLTKSLKVQEDMLTQMQQLVKINVGMFKLMLDSNKTLTDKEKEKIDKQLAKEVKSVEPPVKPALSYAHSRL